MSKYDPKKDSENEDEQDGEEDKLVFHPGTNPENQAEICMLMGD
jgi:hypothetical protein